MNLESFKHDDWVKIYDGKWSFLTSTHFIDQYTREIKFSGKPFESQSVIFVANGYSHGWMRQTDRDLLGNYLSNQIVENPQFAEKLSENLKSQAKKFLKFIDQKENTVATLNLYDEFWRRLLGYYKTHINVKYVVDYLSPKLLERHLSSLQKARLIAEPVLNRSEDFMVSFCKLLSKKLSYHYNLWLCLTKHELKGYLLKGTLPSKSELISRDKKAALIGQNGSFNFYTGDKVKQIEKLVYETIIDRTIIKGYSAFPGKVTGAVRVISDPKQTNNFKAGDILIAGATRPEFLPIMHKAAGFVTDAGGILSHAAITAREMQKPCIVGTKIATSVLKDGDVIEVDANHGVVRKLHPGLDTKHTRDIINKK